MELINSFLRWINRCRDCEADAIQYSIVPRIPNLRSGEAIKGGREFMCVKCGTIWFASSSPQFLTKIANTPLYQSWRDAPVTPSEVQRNALNGIGTAADYYGDTLYIPCQTRDKNGKSFEKAMVLVSKEPHAGRWHKDAISLLTSDIEIKPSRFALAADVRRATIMAPELSMGYAPVAVVDRSGKKYTLSTQGHFFDCEGVLGPDITLDTGPAHGKNRVYPHEPEHYYLCDWIDMTSRRPT